MSNRVVILSGYFDPLHVGHLEMIRRASLLECDGDETNRVVVIVNSDLQAKLKKDGSFMPESDRRELVGAIRGVSEAVLSIDTDRTVCATLARMSDRIRRDSPGALLIFANGGDRHNGEIPEAETCREHVIRLVDGLGDKIRSSSAIVARAAEVGLC